MKTRTITASLSVTAAAAICLLTISPARAQSNRTWVAPSGDDNNSCTNAKPCKTFAGALAKTNAGGEIVVKESGGFGAVTIDRSITIDAGGKYAGIQSGGVQISAGNADVIVLRGLTIKGFGLNGSAGTGIYAVHFGGVLHVENCAISNFSADGINGGAGTLFVQDTVISECPFAGIDMQVGGRAVIEHSRLENNGTGLYLSQGSQVTVRSTIASGNKSAGFETQGGTLNLENCVASNNNTGVEAFGPGMNGPAIVVISNSVVTNNHFGLSQSCEFVCSDSPSVIYSRGNNTVAGNDADISGTITPLGGS